MPKNQGFDLSRFLTDFYFNKEVWALEDRAICKHAVAESIRQSANLPGNVARNRNVAFEACIDDKFKDQGAV